MTGKPRRPLLASKCSLNADSQRTFMSLLSLCTSSPMPSWPSKLMLANTAGKAQMIFPIHQGAASVACEMRLELCSSAAGHKLPDRQQQKIPAGSPNPLLSPCHSCPFGPAEWLFCCPNDLWKCASAVQMAPVKGSPHFKWPCAPANGPEPPFRKHQQLSSVLCKWPGGWRA